MKKLVFVGVLTLVLSCVGFAQDKNIKREIQWKSAELITLDSLTEIQRLNFVDAVYHPENQIPHHVQKIELKSGRITDAEIRPLSMQILNNEQLRDITDANLIPAEFTINIQTTEIRKKKHVYLDVVPLRRNPDSGSVEMLTSYEVLYHVDDNFSDEKVENVFAETSKLASGDWYKFRVSESGVYEIPYSVVADLGFSNPSEVGVFGFGGMVPKVNYMPRYDDLPERPVHLQDNNANGSFDSGDALIVYLEGPDEFTYNSSSDEYAHEIHNYSDYAFYFLSDQSSQKRISSTSETKSPTYVTSNYDYNLALEKDSINIIGSGRTMYWRHFNYYLSYGFNFTVPDRVAGEDAKIFIDLAARSSVTSKFRVTLNGALSFTEDVSAVSGSYSTPYAIESMFELEVPISESNYLKIDYIQGNSSSEAWLDRIVVNARAKLEFDGNQLPFRDAGGIGVDQVSQYNIAGCSSSTMIWDVTDPVNVFGLDPDGLTGDVLSVTASSEELREFIAVNPNGNFSVPDFDGDGLGLIDNQNLHAHSQVEYIIISNPDFLNYATQLGELHQAIDDLSYMVTTPQEIYNEFSSGTPDVAALRDFVKMFYDRAEGESDMPKYLLLFGDGSYDNRAESGQNGNFVPTYQSITSLSPTGSFVSDDFFGLLDNLEGGVSGSEGLDIGVGRLPVKSTQEAEQVLNKIVNYVSPKSFGNWKNIVTFVGDDAEDYMTHEEQANEMGDTIMDYHKDFNVDKILLDAYEQVSTVQGARYPEVNQEIDERINKGTLIFNYSGHGNEKTLAHEAVVTLSQINAWNNFNNLPVFITATCEFSRFDDHELTSAGEQILLNPQGGGIALFTTTRLVYSGDNFRLNTEFYRQVFKQDDQNRPYALGEIIMHTKNIATNSINKRNFSLLGDPALKLEVPDYLVVTDSINGADVTVETDTVGAASLVRVQGHITDRDGNLLDDFNGVLYPTVYDKVMDYLTLGNDQNPPLEYKEQVNVLYSGKASVEDGFFSFEFIVPVDIAYFFGNGKISYYAHSALNDAHGYYDDFIIGGSGGDVNADNLGPEIELFMNTEDFVDGGITDENPLMLANLWDESGINTVGNGIGHDITAVLDENTLNAIVLNDFYEADLDSYQSGKINYPFSDLSTGVHTLRLKVWDVFNNSSEAEISFIVANSSELVIEQVLCYPNPLTDYTCFEFNHNHPNENLDVQISIYNMNGQLIHVINESIYATGYSISPICWNADSGSGSRVDPGIYVYNVRISAENGDVVNKFEKLVVVK